MSSSVIAFDVDGVLLEPKSSWSIIHNYFGVRNEKNLKEFINGDINYQEFIDRDVGLWLGKMGSISKGDFEKIRKLVNPNPNFKLLSSFLDGFKGKKVAISGGVDVIVSKINDYFSMDEVHSNALVFKGDKLFCGRAVVDPYAKGVFLRKFDGRKISVGDSRWDEDMFRKSDYSILFNSSDDIGYVDCVIKGNDLKDLTTVLSDLI